jgi:hypothetical protein
VSRSASSIRRRLSDREDLSSLISGGVLLIELGGAE